MTIDIETIEELTNATEEGSSVIDFYADWCGPCKMVSPALEQICQEHDVPLIKVNIDEVDKAAEIYGVFSIPCIVRKQDGTETHRVVGALPKAKLADQLDL